MGHARQLFFFLVASTVAPLVWARPPPATQETSGVVQAPDLSLQRELIVESNAARAAGDYATARALALEVVTHLLARPAAEQDAAWLALLDDAGFAAYDAQDSRTANSAWKRVYEVRSATLPADHPELQWARGNLALTIKALGDLAGARVLEEQVLEVRSAALPADHPALQTARGNLAETLRALGDLAGARALQEQVLEVRSAALPADHPGLQRARQNLALTLKKLGDLAGARALEEQVLEVRSRTLPADHPELQSARLNLAVTILALGDVAGARALFEQALEVWSRTLPADHPDLQKARQNLATTLHAQGDLAGARALQEQVLEVHSRTLPADHPELQTARQNLAVTLHAQGDLAGARGLLEQVLEVHSRVLPADHLELQKARLNLAATLYTLRDLAGARTLLEQALEVCSRTLPADHPDLQSLRMNLAVTMGELGDLARARALEEQVLEVRLAALPADHPDLQDVRQNLAATMVSEQARSARSSASGEGEWTRDGDGRRERCGELIGALCRAQVSAARAAILGSPAREAEERCASLAKKVSVSLSFAQGYGVFEPLRELESPVFVFAETTRGAALASAELARRAAHSPEYRELRESLRAASEELAGLAQKGTTSAEFDRARVKRESVERELVALAHELSGGGGSGVELEVESLAARLTEGEAAVAFRRFKSSRVGVVDELDATGQPALREVATDSLCAFVVRSSKAHSQAVANGGAASDAGANSSLTLIDLGPIAPIEQAARAWREGIGVTGDSRGVAVGVRAGSSTSVHADGVLLRQQIFDPLLARLAGVERVIVVLDDVLHLVPLDALPLDEETLLGDRWQIETRTTLTELLISRAAFEDAGALVAFGDVAYGTDVGFSALPATGVEVRGIARSFVDQFGEDSAPTLCERASATRARLIELAPQARYLHIATHGWFAPESIRSWSDPEPLDVQTGLGSRLSGEQQVKGMSPMLLCGLALAGASLPEDAVGRTPGLVTADELSTLDLSNCELAVLSACDTNAGERRAGQGVASLQKALQMAGARSVITSLWKVPDEATKELMLDFYRRLWVEQKPKHQALWEAKQRLRDARDESGEPLYTTRDWAAWVLTGEQE